ncbi:MAG TPA: IclR family transcriptional regulator C-terminal domain-containing protein [Galbitalea sp.]|nr:IclR family transcriptional regulator C-terminal domain-containing protein [Galbitalea sp.]
MVEPASMDASASFVQSLSRGLAVIRAFDVDSPQMTLSDVARKTSLTRATARRFLHTLAALGYIRTDGRQFALTVRVLELGYSYLSSLSLPEIAQPHLESLSALVGESTSASVLDDAEIVYIARVPMRRIMTVGISIGTRFPAYATSMGRVLLAGLDQRELDETISHTGFTHFTSRTIASREELVANLAKVRQQGYALVDQELEPGLRSMAVPIELGGKTIAAVNISSSAADGNVETFRQRCLPELQNTARNIVADLQASRPISPLLY